MTPQPRLITENTLRFDLSEAGHSLVRELAMACKKMGIYGPEHQISLKAIEKPFFDLSRLFQSRSTMSIQVQRQQLLVCNISIKESVFTGQLLQYLQVLDVNSLVIERTVSFDQLVIFIECLVRRDALYDASYSLGQHLKRRNVTTIHVNSPLGLELFESRKQYRGELDGDFSVRRLALDQMGSDPTRLALLRTTEQDALSSIGVDFDRDVVQYLLPERIAQLPAATIRQHLLQLREVTAEAQPQSSELFASLVILAECHPKRGEIVEGLDRSSATKPTGHVSAAPVSQLRQELADQIDAVIDRQFTSAAPYQAEKEFAELFQRIIKTGDRDKAMQVTARLYELFGVTDANVRQRALSLLCASIGQLENLHTELLDVHVEQACRMLQSKSEPFELSELIPVLAEQTRKLSLWQQLLRLVTTMAERRHVEKRITVYDSAAVKKSFEQLHRPILVQPLVQQLMTASHETAVTIRNILVTLGSTEVAQALSEIISHPIRSVRQQALKVLAELGGASLQVFSGIIFDDRRFEREAGRHELPDASWYIIRNSIFVLGSLHDKEALVPLRLRIGDPDVRVRREIVSALERIGGDDAIDLLAVMAEDSDKEIREAAVIALGLVGTAESVPLLIDLLKRVPSVAPKAFPAIGKIGGQDALSYLLFLLDDATESARLASGAQLAKDDLKAIVIRALGSIGDPVGLDKLRKYQDSLSGVTQLIFPNSPVRQALTEVLSRR